MSLIGSHLPAQEIQSFCGVNPTQNLLERLIAALDAAGDDENLAEPERSKLKQIALGLRGFAYHVAIGALGGAGGHMLSG